MAAVEEAEAHWVIAVSLCGQASIRKALDGSGANGGCGGVDGGEGKAGRGGGEGDGGEGGGEGGGTVGCDRGGST